MTVSVFADGQKIFLNPFMTTLTENIILAICDSLKAPAGNTIELILRAEELQVTVDQQQVPVNVGRAQKIVGSVIRGLLSSMHGAETGSEFRFLCEK